MRRRSLISSFWSRRFSARAPYTSATKSSSPLCEVIVMRYLLLVQTTPDAAGPTGPDERLADEMGKLLEAMTKAGVLLDTAGLRPIEEATRIRLADGKQTVIDGPFTECKEIIGGYCLLQRRSTDGGQEWASGRLAPHGLEREGGVEIRQLDDPI